MNFLKSHPFGVKAHFEESTVLTFAVRKEDLMNLIPAPLSLDTFQDQWAFIAVAMVATRELRPAGFPKFLGNKFFLIGYRIFVRYKNKAGKNLRGLYILKSETDKISMELLGNIFTNYQYSNTDIQQSISGDQKIIASKKSDFKVQIDLSKKKIDVPVDSPFSNWKEARRFAGPLPHTFTVDTHKREVLIIRGLRQNWIPQPISIKNYHLNFLKKLGLEEVVLASAFQIKNIPYQ